MHGTIEERISIYEITVYHRLQYLASKCGSINVLNVKVDMEFYALFAEAPASGPNTRVPYRADPRIPPLKYSTV
jgi:hypothetical protein